MVKQKILNYLIAGDLHKVVELYVVRLPVSLTIACTQRRFTATRVASLITMQYWWTKLCSSAFVIKYNQ